METPLVSVIIPTYSRPVNLIRAVKSVLAQDYSNIEIIVVDDNGKGTQFNKETAEILKPFIENDQVVYLEHDVNRNGSAARNTGLKKSKGTYINFFDDDDEMASDKISEQVNFLETYKEFGACFCDTEAICGKKRLFIRNQSQANWIESILLGESFFNTSTVLFRKSVIQDLNGFDESFNRHQDWELYIRFLRKYNFGKVECRPLKKYETPNLISKNPGKSVEYMEKFLSAFKDEIMQQPRGKMVFRYQYEKLTELLLAAMEYRKALYCIRQGFKYGFPSFKRLFRYSYSLVRPVLHGKTI